MAVQRFAALEIVTIAVIGIGFFAVCTITGSYLEKSFAEYKGRELLVAESFTNKLDDYESFDDATMELSEEVRTVLDKAYGEDGYLRASVLEASNDGYNVVLAVGKAGNIKQESYYKGKVLSLVKNSLEKKLVSYDVVNSERSLAVAVDNDSKMPKRVLVVELAMDEVTEAKDAVSSKAIIYALCGWFAASLLLLIVVLLQDLEWKRVIKTTEKISISKEGWKKPPIHTSEMQLLWNSLGEILKNVAKANYEKFKTFQAYFRFAPKSIERILEKTSISDVHTGDVVDIKGTLALAYISGDKSLKKREIISNINKKFVIMSDCQRNHEGLYLSGDGDLKRQSYMFLDSPQQAMLFGIETCMRFEENRIYDKEKALIMLHPTELTYGICGDDEQATVSVVSDEMNILKKYLRKLSQNGVRMIVTDNMPEEIRDRFSSRYIGFIEQDGKGFKLYEVLDAYPEKERRIRMKTNDKLQQALSLFYKNDYYLARNAFSEVLRECPTDGLAKWYIFRCEDYLNNQNEVDPSFALFADD